MPVPIGTQLLVPFASCNKPITPFLLRCANVVKCRPPDNRDPHSQEINACDNFLQEQIAIVNPTIIATLGRISMSIWFPNEKISQISRSKNFFKEEFNSFSSFTSVGRSTHITASTPASLIFFANFSIP